MKTKYTPEILTEISRRYLNNERLVLLAKEYGFCDEVLRLRLRAFGTPPLPKRQGINNAHWCGCGGLSAHRFSSIRQGALTRNISFEITIEQVWSLFCKQDKKCALSGIDLILENHLGDKQRPMTASLDRIDSNDYYHINNVQWIHKTINIMKGQLKQDYFIGLCKTIHNYQSTLANTL